MRIIDKNTDFYDFYQNIYRDDTFTFDRRNSFLLTKERICNNLLVNFHWSFISKKREYNTDFYLLLQICNTFWFFHLEATELTDFGRVKNYEIELVDKWRDFNKERKLCEFDIIEFYYHGKNERLVEDVKIENYRGKRSLSKTEILKGNEWEEKTIPILRACGIVNCVDAHEVYLAFEEYFSLEKSGSERREPIGTTDIDKIESHGFDKVTSFRGKNK